MRDVFFTLLVIWVLWRIFGSFSRSKGSFTFNTQNNNYSEPKKKEGEVTLDNPNLGASKKNKNEVGEYVDFEEIKDK